MESRGVGSCGVELLKGEDVEPNEADGPHKVKDGAAASDALRELKIQCTPGGSPIFRLRCRPHHTPLTAGVGALRRVVTPSCRPTLGVL